MNAVEMLTRQHREMEAALEGVMKADGPARRAAFAKAADVLVSHVEVEEQVFYPMVKAKRTEDILLESLEEHLSLKRLIADLVEMSVSDPQFEPKLHVLKEQSEHHHEEEEEKLFPKVKKMFSDEELDGLGEEMGRFQARLLATGPRFLAKQETDAAAVVR